MSLAAKLRLCAVVASLTSFVPISRGRAQAASDPPSPAGAEELRREGEVHYAQGRVFFRASRYAEAAAEFEAAYERLPNPVILYALGQSYEGMMDLVRAIDAYRRYLGTAGVDDARRAEVTERIAQLDQLLVRVTITSNVPATIFVDGEEAGTAPGEVPIPIGRHEIVLRAEGYDAVERTVMVSSAGSATQDFVLVERAFSREVVRVTEARRDLGPTAFYVTVGIAGAGALTFVSLGAVARSRVNAYESSPVRTERQRTDAQAWNRRADIVLGVTGAAVVGSVITGLLTEFDDEEADEEGGTEAVVAIVPTRDGAAVAIAGRF